MFINTEQIPTYATCLLLGAFLGYKFKKPFRVTKNIFQEPSKLVLIVRQDLNMSKGKIAAQCCHGTLLSFIKISKVNPELCNKWLSSGQPKVVVKANNLEEIKFIKSNADKLKIDNELVYDQGRTQVAAGTITVLAVGPDDISRVDKITSHLKLL